VNALASIANQWTQDPSPAHRLVAPLVREKMSLAPSLIPHRKKSTHKQTEESKDCFSLDLSP
jgi:hypothetical protein